MGCMCYLDCCSAEGLEGSERKRPLPSCADDVLGSEKNLCCLPMFEKLQDVFQVMFG